MRAISAVAEHLVLLVVNNIHVVQNKPTDRQPLLQLSPLWGNIKANVFRHEMFSTFSHSRIYVVIDDAAV